MLQTPIISRYAIAMRFCVRIAAITAVLTLFGCNKAPEVAATGPSTVKIDPVSKPVPTNGKIHSLAKYIEISGFRLSEPKAGTVRVRMNVVNHSNADLGELPMKVSIMAAGAKPEDPPIAEVAIKVTLGPEETKQAEASSPSKVRLYELPDWQFLRCTFEITAAP
jgi:hypothetical protein